MFELLGALPAISTISSKSFLETGQISEASNGPPRPYQLVDGLPSSVIHFCHSAADRSAANNDKFHDCFS
jgi:hypothetical protein